MPSYQAGERLAAFVDRLVGVLGASGIEWEVIVVDDGSTDGSTATVAAARVGVVRHPQNRGKGAAIRTGFGVAAGRFIAVIDGDGQYDPSGLLPLMELCEAGWDVAVGQRFDAAARTNYSAPRTTASRVMLGLVRLIVDNGLSETQAGIKVFRSEMVSAVGPHLECDGFAIDVELLAWGRRLGFRRQAVHPVAFEHDGETTVTARRALGMLRDLAAIRRRLERSGLGGVTRPTRRASAQERRALELWAHAARLCALEPRTVRSAEEIVVRASGDARVVRAAAALAAHADRRSGPPAAGVVDLLNEAASMLERASAGSTHRVEGRFA